jgi:hypothetical protein
MMRKDARAVENPISAVFDLAEEVTEQQPKLRRLIRYATIFIAVGLFTDFIFIVILLPISFPFLLVLLISLLLLRWFDSTTARAILISVATMCTFFILLLFAVLGALSVRAAGMVVTLFIGVLLIGLFILGLVILNLFGEIGGFFDYYFLRYRIIKSVRDQDPIVHIPQGEDSVRRVLNYLTRSSPDLIRDFSRPGAVLIPAAPRGRGGLPYRFDAYASRPSGALWRTFKVGYPGYAIYIKKFAQKPGLSDLETLKQAVEDVTAATRLPPRRIIAIWTREGEDSLEDAAYDFLTSEAAVAKGGVSLMNCSLELIAENPDGTYDFIPYITDVPARRG